jgi:hypothetical protein
MVKRMPYFSKMLEDFIKNKMQNGGWTEQNPPWDDIKWAWSVSEQFLRDKGRRGENWMWIKERSVEEHAETEQLTTAWHYVDVYCFASSFTVDEDDCRNARERMNNMREMVAKIVKANNKAFPPAWNARPFGEHPLPDSNVDPPFFCLILTVGFQYGEDST